MEYENIHGGIDRLVLMETWIKVLENGLLVAAERLVVAVYHGRLVLQGTVLEEEEILRVVSVLVEGSGRLLVESTQLFQ